MLSSVSFRSLRTAVTFAIALGVPSLFGTGCSSAATEEESSNDELNVGGGQGVDDPLALETSCSAEPLRGSNGDVSRLLELFPDGARRYDFAEKVRINLYERSSNTLGTGPWKQSAKAQDQFGAPGSADQTIVDLEARGQVFLTMDSQGNVSAQYVQDGFNYHVGDGSLGRTDEEVRTSVANLVSIEDCHIDQKLGLGACQTFQSTYKEAADHTSTRRPISMAWSASIGRDCARIALKGTDKARGVEQMFVVIVKK